MVKVGLRISPSRRLSPLASPLMKQVLPAPSSPMRPSSSPPSSSEASRRPHVLVSCAELVSMTKVMISACASGKPRSSHGRPAGRLVGRRLEHRRHRWNRGRLGTQENPAHGRDRLGGGCDSYPPCDCRREQIGKRTDKLGYLDQAPAHF